MELMSLKQLKIDAERRQKIIELDVIETKSEKWEATVAASAAAAAFSHDDDDALKWKPSTS